MSEPKSLARPPQAALAGWLVVGGSVIVVLTALGQGAVLHSLDTREAVQEYLSRPPGDELGLGVQGMLTLLRVVWTVAAAVGAASAVLGWYALQRSKGARLALSLLALPLFVASFLFVGTPGASIFPAMVSAAIVMLWFQPARDWFDGVVREAPAPPPPLPAPPTAPTGRDPLLDLPPPTAPPLHPTPYAAQPGREASAPAVRPRPVVWACALTWATSAVAFLLFAVNLAQLATGPDELLDEADRRYPELSMSDADLSRLLAVMFVVFMVWSVVAAGLTLLVWRRVAWASVALTVSAVLACVTLLPLVACVATVVLLQRPESRAWFRAGRPA
jgi:hypothetical protein